MGVKGNHPFIAIDIETTGLNRSTAQILQIGATVYGGIDSPGTQPSDQFMSYVRHREYHGQAAALAMNQNIFARLAKGEGVALWRAIRELNVFILERCRENPYPVGFNVGSFDLTILRRDWYGEWPFHHRVIEIGSLCANLDGTPTSSNALAALRGHEVTHDALEDALDARFYHEHWIQQQKERL
jgi:DNA polymerase III epsilon subunit-like protein